MYGLYLFAVLLGQHTQSKQEANTFRVCVRVFDKLCTHTSSKTSKNAVVYANTCISLELLRSMLAKFKQKRILFERNRFGTLLVAVLDQITIERNAYLEHNSFRVCFGQATCRNLK